MRKTQLQFVFSINTHWDRNILIILTSHKKQKCRSLKEQGRTRFFNLCNSWKQLPPSSSASFCDMFHPAAEIDYLLEIKAHMAQTTAVNLVEQMVLGELLYLCIKAQVLSIGFTPSNGNQSDKLTVRLSCLCPNSMLQLLLLCHSNQARTIL